MRRGDPYASRNGARVTRRGGKQRASAWSSCSRKHHVAGKRGVGHHQSGVVRWCFKFISFRQMLLMICFFLRCDLCCQSQGFGPSQTSSQTSCEFPLFTRLIRRSSRSSSRSKHARDQACGARRASIFGRRRVRMGPEWSSARMVAQTGQVGAWRWEKYPE